MAVDHKNQLIASVQKGNYQKNDEQEISLPCIKIWNYISLKTLFSFQNFDKDTSVNVLSVAFSKSVKFIYFIINDQINAKMLFSLILKGFLLVLVLLDNLEVKFYYHDWKNNRLITKAHKLARNEEVYGLVFHPDNDNQFFSFGKRNFILWMLQNDEILIKKVFKNVSNLLILTSSKLGLST